MYQAQARAQAQPLQSQAPHPQAHDQAHDRVHSSNGAGSGSGFEVNFGTGSSVVLGNNQVQSYKDALSTSELSRPSGSGILKMSKTGNGLENGSRGVVGNVGNAGNVNGKGNGKMKHGAANDRNNVAFYKVSKSQSAKNDVITDGKKSHGDSSSKRGKSNKRQL